MASHRSGGIQMNLAVICIYQEPFKIRLNNDHFQKMLPKSLELSSDKTGGEYFSISIILGHVSSWSAGAIFKSTNDGQHNGQYAKDDRKNHSGALQLCFPACRLAARRE